MINFFLEPRTKSQELRHLGQGLLIIKMYIFYLNVFYNTKSLPEILFHPLTSASQIYHVYVLLNLTPCPSP